jgi:hypothetical protein
MQLKGANWKPGDHGFGSKLGPDSAEHPLKPHIKTQNRAKRCNRLDNRNRFGTRGSEVQILSPRPIFLNPIIELASLPISSPLQLGSIWVG